MNTKPKKTWAIVNKKFPSIDIQNIYDTRDVELDASEQFIRVEIKEVEN